MCRNEASKTVNPLEFTIEIGRRWSSFCAIFMRGYNSITMVNNGQNGEHFMVVVWQK